MEKAHHIYAFEDFALDLTAGSLRRSGQEVKLRPKSFEALRYLVENSGRLVSKDELMQRLWSDSFVTENSLVKCMMDVRLALGDDTQRYIKTVPRRGYIFTAPVSDNNSLRPDAGYRQQVEGIRVVIEDDEQKYEALNKAGTGFSHPAVSMPSRDPRQVRRSVLVVIGLAVFAAVVLYFLVRSGSNHIAPVKTKSIAVLPFKPLVVQSRDESLEMGMADTLITRLSNLRQIIVRPISAVRNYDRLDQDPVAAGREQRVDAVLEGNLQMAGDKIRVTVRLLSVPDGTQLWADKFDEKLANIFIVQDSISEKVAAALAITLSDQDQNRLTKRYTENIEAYQLYLKGRYFWDQRTEEGMKKAVVFFEQAIQIDQNYALAYAGIGHTYTALGALGFIRPAEASERMRFVAAKALELDDTLAEAHTVMATYEKAEFNWQEAEREFKRAIELNPNYAFAHAWYGYLLEGLGREDENLAERTRAHELDPLNLAINAGLGDALFHVGLYDKAIEQQLNTLELNPNFSEAHDWLGDVYLAKGMYEKAVSEYQQAGNKASLGYTYAVMGKKADAKRILAELYERSRQRYVTPLDKAIICIGLGEKDQGFEWLEKSYAERVPALLFLKVDQRFSNVRSDPRFRDLLRRLGLAPTGLC